MDISRQFRDCCLKLGPEHVAQSDRDIGCKRRYLPVSNYHRHVIGSREELLSSGRAPSWRIRKQRSTSLM